MNNLKKVILILLVVLIVIQFFHPNQNHASIKFPTAIATIYTVPPKMATILNKACNDCHSNNTRYPWYNNIQPVAWWLDSHVQDGKRGLNFDQFASYRIGKQYHRMQDIIDEVKEGDMPLSSYTIIHTDARLNEEEKAALIGWANSIRNTIKQQYPPDSLVTKKRA